MSKMSSVLRAEAIAEQLEQEQRDAVIGDIDALMQRLERIRVSVLSKQEDI